MSAFEGRGSISLCEIAASTPFIIVGVATEIGIEPTARHGADLGYIPVLVTDACGAGNEEAAKRSIENLKFAGDTILADTERNLCRSPATSCRSQLIKLTRAGYVAAFATTDTIRTRQALSIHEPP